MFNSLSSSLHDHKLIEDHVSVINIIFTMLESSYPLKYKKGIQY